MDVIQLWKVDIENEIKYLKERRVKKKKEKKT